MSPQNNGGTVVAAESLFTDEWRRQTVANTTGMYDFLLPTTEQLQDPRLKGVAIEQATVIIQGDQGSGKTAKADAIIEKVRERYGGRNVTVHVSHEERGSAQKHFRRILDAPKWPKCMVHVLLIEDATNVKFDENDLQDFWQIRHVMRQKTGLARGLVLLVFTEHSYYEFQKQFRLTPDVILMSDMPVNPRHRQECERTFITSAHDRQRLEYIETERKRNPPWRGLAYMIRRGKPTGFVHLPQVAEPKKESRWQMPSLHPSQVQVTEPAVQRKDMWIVYVAFAVLGGLTLYSASSGNWSGVVLWGAVLVALGLASVVGWMRSYR